MLHVRVPTALQDVEKARNVGIDVLTWVIDRIPHASLRGQMHDPVDRASGEQGVDADSVAQRHADKLECVVRPEPRKTCLFQRRIVIRIQVVEPDHTIAAGEQSLGDMHPDETGGTSDENGSGHVD